MCELFAMSASEPHTVRYELDLFAQEGGEKHRNRDGWGILFAGCGRIGTPFYSANPILPRRANWPKWWCEKIARASI